MSVGPVAHLYFSSLLFLKNRDLLLVCYLSRQLAPISKHFGQRLEVHLLLDLCLFTLELDTEYMESIHSEALVLATFSDADVVQAQKKLVYPEVIHLSSLFSNFGQCGFFFDFEVLANLSL